MINENELNELLDNIQNITKHHIATRMHNHNGWSFVDNSIFNLSIKNDGLAHFILKGGKNKVEVVIDNNNFSLNNFITKIRDSLSCEELCFDNKDPNAFTVLSFYTKLLGYNNVSLKYNNDLILEIK